ncbi:MAG: hypothetical protein ABSE04_00195 [Candidatus Microgenomates bacterium]|jgi:hypothetical protein
MGKFEKFLNKYGWLLALILAIPTVLALLHLGFYGASDDLHPAWLYEMDRVLKAGIFPPRFVPDLSFGFGYPLFNFIYPFPFYLGEIFHLEGLSLVGSTKAVLFLGIPLSVAFMFAFLKKFMKSDLSLVGSLIYGYLPYRSTEIYVRGDIGEAFSFVFFPLISLSVFELTKGNTKNRWRYIGLGGISVALLVLTHDIAAYMFLPFAVLLGILFLVFIKPDRIKRVVNFILMFLLGALGSLYFWFPALTQSSLLKYSTVYDFQDYFLPVKRLITPYFGYGGFPTMSFFIGFAAFVSIILGSIFLILLFRKINQENRIIFLWALITLLISLFMMNIRSTFIWNLVPLLPYFQFPWRFLTMVVFISPIFLLGLNDIKFRVWIALGIGILTIVTTISYFHPQDYLERTDSYYLARYIPVPVVLPAYLTQDEEYLRLPEATEVRPTKDYPIAYTSGSEIKNIVAATSLASVIRTDSTKSFTLNYSKYNFPGWNATVDGKSVQLSSGAPFGQITINIPAGTHVINIFFRETILNTILDILSLCTFLFCLGLAVRSKQ